MSGVGQGARFSSSSRPQPQSWPTAPQPLSTPRAAPCFSEQLAAEQGNAGPQASPSSAGPCLAEVSGHLGVLCAGAYGASFRSGSVNPIVLGLIDQQYFKKQFRKLVFLLERLVIPRGKVSGNPLWMGLEFLTSLSHSP